LDLDAPGEQHGCPGCHGDKALAPENRWPLTLKRFDTPTALLEKNDAAEAAHAPKFRAAFCLFGLTAMAGLAFRIARAGAKGHCTAKRACQRCFKVSHLRGCDR